MKCMIASLALFLTSSQAVAETGTYDPRQDGGVPVAQGALARDAARVGWALAEERHNMSKSRATEVWPLPAGYGEALDAWLRPADRDGVVYGRYLVTLERWSERRHAYRETTHAWPHR